MNFSIWKLILLFPVFVHGTALFEDKVVFAQWDNGYSTYRIPVLYETMSGTLLAFAEGRRNDYRDRGDIDIVLRRSLDGGTTWSPLQVVWDDELNTCGNPTVVQDRSNGRIWLFATHNLGHDSQTAISRGQSEGVRTIWSCYSDDDGVSWSDPVNRFDEVQPKDTRWDATGPGRGIQLRKGEHAGRLIIPVNGRCVYSDDHGQTWQQSEWLPKGSSESQIVELFDGRLLRNDRRVQAPKGRAFSWSDDGGETWDGISYREDLPDPRCMGSTIALHGGKLLVFSNPSMEGNDSSSRYNMSVQYSLDGGDTWRGKKTIFDGASAYSCLSPIGTNWVGLLYENGDSSSSGPELYRKITFVKFSEKWLLSTSDVSTLRVKSDFTQGSDIRRFIY